MKKVSDTAARRNAAPLFAGWETALVTSALEGRMGDLWQEDAEKPAWAFIANGDFWVFGGECPREEVPSLAAELGRQYGRRDVIMAAREKEWMDALGTVFGERARPVLRYATQRTPEAFDRARLEGYAKSLPKGVQIVPIDAYWYEKVLASPWAADFVSQFGSAERFMREGIGYLAVLEGEIVSGASSYVACEEEIEVQIDTREDFRRQGLARACGARLILSCLERNRYPSWDAMNLESLKLAECLGYCLACEYPVWEVELRG